MPHAAPLPEQRRLPLVALITEPLSDLGRAVALAFAAESARIVMRQRKRQQQQQQQRQQQQRQRQQQHWPTGSLHLFLLHPLNQRPLPLLPTRPARRTRGDASSAVHRIARTALSRQGAVDIIISLPPAGNRGGAAGLLHRVLPSAAGGGAAAPPASAPDQALFLRRAVGELLPDPDDRTAGKALSQAEPEASYRRFVISVLAADSSGEHSRDARAWGRQLAKAAGTSATVLSILLPAGAPTSGGSPALAGAVAELALLPWRQDLAAGQAHEVILQFPGGAPRAPDAASAGGAAAPRPAAWLQLTRERDGIPVGDAAAVRAAEDGRGQPSPYPLAPPPPMVAACYAAHPVSCGNGLTLGGGADVATTGDALEAFDLGVDPGPSPSATQRADPARAVWLPPGSLTGCCGGIVEATGARKAPGLLTRPSQPGELGLGKQDRSGAVLGPADPKNLEPSMTPDQYTGQPRRDAAMMVHCFAPFNAETPHTVLSKEFLTPPGLFYVRNHLPVPCCDNPEELTVSGASLGGRALELSLDDLKTGRYGPTMHMQASLQCAGNRRNEMAAVKLVEGRAPWNHGAIGNALWGGVALRDVLAAAGLDLSSAAAALAQGAEGREVVRHVVLKGLDWHRETQMHYSISIPIHK
ncbi:sulfite oxidase, partial [Monoraphidium neglectum]